MPVRKKALAAAPQRDTYHHGDLRRALLESAIALIAEIGADAFTLREVARRTGVNHRAAYRHFASKEDLLAAIAEQGYRGLVDAISGALREVEETDPLARLYALGDAYVRFALAEPASYGVMFGRRLNEDGRFPALEQPISEAVMLLAREIENGQAKGVLRKDRVRDLGFSFWASVHGVASLVISRRIRISAKHRKEYVATLLSPTLRGLLER